MRLSLGQARQMLASAAAGLLSTTSFAAVAPAAVSPAAHLMAPDVTVQASYTPMADVQDLGPTFPCQAAVPVQCYGPAQLRAAYDVQPVLDGGTTGAGRTIVIVEAFQSPSVQADLATFDAIFQLPAPPKFSVQFPDGATPFDPSNPVQIGWAIETSADVEWAHAIAPGAAIDVVFAKSPSDVDLLSAVEFAVDNRLGDVVSQSFGEAEQCAAPGVIERQHAVYQRAISRGITLLASTGDQGATQPNCDGSGLLGVRAVSTPASDPLVTAVGGTVLFADGSTGAYQGEIGWPGSGGGFSEAFRRPGFQSATHIGSDRRGVPDVAYNAGIGVIIVWGLLAPPGHVGLGVIGGTSLGPPQWAGVVALADQRAGRALGWLNPSLYRVQRSPARPSPFHDIVAGNNSFAGVAGFAAGPGWDAVTGLGSPDVATLLSVLVLGRDESA